MKLAYVDSSIWIARFEGLLTYRRKIDEELARLARDGFSFAASDAVLLEVLLKPAQAGTSRRYGNAGKVSPSFSAVTPGTHVS